MRSLLLAAALPALALAGCSEPADDTATTDTTAEAPAAPDAAMPETSVMDANTATADELAGAPGMTPELASAIVAGQPYDSASAFNTVLLETLSPEQAATVRERVFVPVNLNSASLDDIRLIPGMTEKMEHEFMEYRPYEDMAEFDREIGKYVDQAGVARFRNYVTL